MSVSSNVNKLWQSFTGKTKPDPVNVVAQRFLKVFYDHGLQAAQIPRLLPQIKLDDLKSEEALLAALTPNVLDQAAHLFGIRTAWLEGVDDDIYDCLHCYKQPEIFFEHLAPLNRSMNDFDDFYVQTLVTTKKLNMNVPSQQLLVVIVVEKIAELGDRDVYRYHVYGDGWDWGYYPTRIQLKAMARLLFNKFGKTMPIYTTKLADLENIREGKQIPQSCLGGCLISEPSLEDYAMSKEEHFHAKEIAELPEVLNYIKENHLIEFIKAELSKPVLASETTSSPEIAPEQPSPIEASKSGKRANNEQELWLPVRAVAGALWDAEGDSLNITAAAKRIKEMKHLKASALSIDAIRKHIRDLAPLNVRGKAGRKPNKST